MTEIECSVVAFEKSHHDNKPDKQSSGTPESEDLGRSSQLTFAELLPVPDHAVMSHHFRGLRSKFLRGTVRPDIFSWLCVDRHLKARRTT